mmetsp:Transcript_4796/g.12277  ORF Transcript_4796/g.12277 Transcript_4796/m.12277 type:complete len:208 (+) Transcript_4796:757-1380(+)
MRSRVLCSISSSSSKRSSDKHAAYACRHASLKSASGTSTSSSSDGSIASKSSLKRFAAMKAHSSLGPSHSSATSSAQDNKAGSASAARTRISWLMLPSTASGFRRDPNLAANVTRYGLKLALTAFGITCKATVATHFSDIGSLLYAIMEPPASTVSQPSSPPGRSSTASSSGTTCSLASICTAASKNGITSDRYSAKSAPNRWQTRT